MTTPTTQPDRMSAEELRAAFKAIQSRIEQLTDRMMVIENIQADERNTLDELTKAIETMLHGIQHAANATTPAPVGTFGEMMIENIVMSYDDNGKPTYKAKGAPYQKHGVRIWEEVLPLLGVNPATLKPGQNPQTPAIRARVLMGENTNQETGTKQTGPRKVTGKV